MSCITKLSFKFLNDDCFSFFLSEFKVNPFSLKVLCILKMNDHYAETMITLLFVT